MARKASILCQINDVDGATWDVREIRPTRHGFAVHFGWPEGKRGPGWGGPRVIPTPNLMEYWEKLRLRRDGSIYDLPMSRTTIKRVRRILGLDYYCDNAEWWLDRVQDLTDMPGRRFAAIHGVHESVVSVMHSRLVGKRNREPGWWREESNADLLRGELPRSYVAERLGISVGAVGRLRWMLRTARQSDDQRTS